MGHDFHGIGGIVCKRLFYLTDKTGGNNLIQDRTQGRGQDMSIRGFLSYDYGGTQKWTGPYK